MISPNVNYKVAAYTGNGAGALSAEVTGDIGKPLTGLSLSPTSVVADQTSTGTVTLSGNAPSGGVAVTLSSDSGFATVPSSVTVA